MSLIQVERRRRKAQRHRHPPISPTDRERLRAKIARSTCSATWTDAAAAMAERCGMTATAQRFTARLAELGIYPPPGDRVHMARCDACRRLFPPQYLIGLFHFRICSDCAIRPAVSDREWEIYRGARAAMLVEILRHAHLSDAEIAALCHRWEGLGQRGIAAMMDRSKTWVRQLLISAERKLREAQISLPEQPATQPRRPELIYMSTEQLERHSFRAGAGDTRDRPGASS